MQEYRRLCRWLDNIRMDLKEIGVDVMNWMDLLKGREHWSTLLNV
jgi:hypothetical protein